MGSAKAQDKQAVFLSEIIQRINDLFAGENINTNFALDYTRTVMGQISENPTVVEQIKHNSFEKVMLGDLPRSTEDAIISSDQLSHQFKNVLLGDDQKAKIFNRILYDMFKQDELR